MSQVDKRQNLLRVLRPVLGGPVTSTLSVVGILLILLGAALQTGVWAGMFGIIGALLLVVSITARVVLWIYQRV